MENKKSLAGRILLAGGLLAGASFMSQAKAEAGHAAELRMNLNSGISLAEGKCGAKSDTTAHTKGKDGKCGDAKCGGKKAKAKDGKCGDKKAKAKDGKCGDHK
jgi:uncharacterized low-complexity protein